MQYPWCRRGVIVIGRHYKDRIIVVHLISQESLISAGRISTTWVITNGSLVAAPPRVRLDGKCIGLASRHKPSIGSNTPESMFPLGIEKPQMLWPVARPQHIIRAAPQRDRDVAPTRRELGRTAVPAHPATLAKPDRAALHRCGPQGRRGDLESPPMLLPGGLHDDVQQSGRELAEHFYGAPRDAAKDGQRARAQHTDPRRLLGARVFMPLATPAARGAF